MTGILISLILLVLAILVFKKDRKTKNYGWLFIFRLLTIIFLGFILLGNIIALSFTKSPNVPLLFLVDVSPSMKDNLTQAKELLIKFKSKTKYRTQYFSFADSIYPLPPIEQLKVKGNKTDIAKALTSIKKNKPGAVILLSDGQHNTFTDPVSVATELPFPVYTIGLGKIVECDVAIRRVQAPKHIYLGETTEVIVRIQSQGLGNKKTKISLLEQGSALLQQTIGLTDNLTEQEISFRLVPSEIGKKLYKIKIDGLEEEANFFNNEQEFGLNIWKSRWKVMLLTNGPNYNTRFLLAGLKSAIVDIKPVIAFQANRWQTLTEQGMQDFIFQLDCDVLILDNFDASVLSSDISNELRKFVQTGGGVLMISGENFRLNQILSDFSPFVLEPRIIRKEIFLRLTNEGALVPIFFDAGEDLLADTPPLNGVMEVKEVVKGTRVWATTDPLAIPLIGYRKFGKGKVIVFNGIPMWRLGFYGKDLAKSEQKFSKLLYQTCRFLAQKDFERFSLTTNQLVYSAGEEVNFIFHAYREDGRPFSGLDVNLIIGKDQIPMIEVADGIYEKTLKALPANDYLVKAIAKLDTLTQGEAKTEVKVSTMNLELIDTRLNDELLKHIAQKSGGEYFDIQSLASHFPPSAFRLASYRQIFKLDPRRSATLYVVLVGLFLIELYFRKRRGLM